MKELEYIPDNNHLTLTDRVAIEVGLAREESFTKIATLSSGEIKQSNL